MTREYIMRFQVDEDGHEYDMTRMERLIRCSECKHWIDNRCRRIRTMDDWRKPTDYCSFGDNEG